MTHNPPAAKRLATFLFATAALLGCGKKAGENSAFATKDANALHAVAEKDLKAIADGLPAAAHAVAKGLTGLDAPEKDPATVRSALATARRDVPEWRASQSTFLALTTPRGIGIRNTLEEDRMAGADFFASFPDLRTLNSKSTSVQTVGEFSWTSKPQPNRDWIVASNVENEKKTVIGILVAGFNFRTFAWHLYEELEKSTKAARTGDKQPIFYVCLFDRQGVYCAPSTTPESESMLREIGLFEKTTSGPFTEERTSDGRSFGISALRLSSLSPETGIVVIHSEI